MNSIEIKDLEQKNKVFKKSAAFNRYGGITLITIGIIFLITSIYILYQFNRFNNFERNLWKTNTVYFNVLINEKAINSPAMKEIVALHQYVDIVVSSNIFLVLYLFITTSFLFIIIGIILRQNFFSFQTSAEILEEIKLTI